MTNVALDQIGQARLLYQYATKLEGKGQSEDDLAFLRDDNDFLNLLICEQENGDFAMTMVRQFFYSLFCKHYYTALLQSSDKDLAAFAEKSLKEVDYHVKHSGEWLKRMGDGTEESHKRAQHAIEELWPYTGEMFMMDEIDEEMIKEGIGADLKAIHDQWSADLNTLLEIATLKLPEGQVWMHEGGKQGRHTERLGFILAEMQFLQRAYPGGEW